MKKILMVSGMFFAFSLAVMPVLAEELSNPVLSPAKITTTAEKIACVRIAVATREGVIATAVATHMQAVQAAYTARALTLDGAYSNSNVKAVQAGVNKVSWTGFKNSIKSATAKWKTSRNDAWSAFRAATKACKSPAGVTDYGNSSLEFKGE